MAHFVRITRVGDTHPVLPEGVVLLDPATGLPATTLPVGVSPRLMIADATLTVTDSSQSLAQLWTAATGAALPAAAVVAELQPQGGSVRLRRSGQAVGASTGRLLLDSDVMTVDTPLADLRLIRSGAANVALNVALFDRV